MADDTDDSDETSSSVNQDSPSQPKDSPAEVNTVPGAVLVSSLIISQVLENFAKGQRKDYDAFVQKLADPLLKPLHLQRYLKALKRCISLLSKKSDILVGTVLNVNWANADDETAHEFIEFLMTLVSAQTYYLRPCLRMLTKLFLPSIPKGCTPQDVDMQEQGQIFTNAHNGLQGILEIVPTTPKFLLPILSEHFPYIKKHMVFQTSYVKNLLHITQYLPLLRHEILECVFNHITKIDVEVPRHELEEPEEEENTQFEVDLETRKEDNQDAELENQKSEKSEENAMGETLDALMDILFHYIKDLCYIDGQYFIDSSTELFNQLVKVYEKILLPTHATCHVPFAMFYICSLDQTFVNSFLDLCWKKIDNPNTPFILRQASSAYMASITARAKFIPTSAVKVCLELLTHWIHCYVDVHDAACSGPDSAKHGPFYSVCQALFYVFVFRHRSLLELEDGHKFARTLNFERIITCRLNPLKVCLPTIVNLFALVTRRHEIVMCYTVIERNKRSMLPVVSVQANRTVSHLTFFNQLDSFFPFDPYLLRRSSKFIKPLYQEWEGVEEESDIHKLTEEGKREFDSEFEEDGEDEEYMQYGKTPDIDVPGLTPESPTSIPPGFAVSPIEYEARIHHGKHRVPKHRI